MSPMALEDEAFPTLTDADLAVVREFGAARPMVAGEYLYREGDVTYDFFVVVSGAVEAVSTADGTERVIAHHEAGRFLGELNLLTGQRVFVSARVVESGEVVVVPRERLRQMIARSPSLGDTILAAFDGSAVRPYDRGCHLHPRHRLALLPRITPGPRVPGPKPDPARMAGPRSRCRGRGAAERVQCRPGRAARRHRLGIGPAWAHARRLGRLPRPHGPEPPRSLLRPGRRGSRARRSGRIRLRCVGRAPDARRRGPQRRWPGRVELSDRELSWLSHRHLRRRPHHAGRRPGREVRGPPHGPVRGRVPALGGRATSSSGSPTGRTSPVGP